MKEWAQAERLEERLAMAVDVYTPPSGGTTDWITVMANEGSDVYLTAVATSSNDLYVASNASFINRQVITNGNNALDEVHVYNGVDSTSLVDFEQQVGTVANYPWFNGVQGTLRFPLASSAIDFTRPITGQIDLNDGTANRIISFTNAGQPQGLLLITSGPGVGTTFNYTTPSQNARLSLNAVNPLYFSSNTGDGGLPVLTITYDSDPSSADIDTISCESAAVSSAGGLANFQVFDPSMHQYVPGTGRGVVQGLFNGSTVDADWQVDSPAIGTAVPLSFNGRNQEIPFFTAPWRSDNGVSSTTTVFIRGTLNTFTGVATFRFRVDSASTAPNFDAATTGPFGIFLPEFTMGLRDFDQTDDPADPLGLLYDSLPNAATIWPGMTFQPALTVDLPTPDSSVEIESPVDSARTTQFSASQVIVNAPLRSDTEFRVPSGSVSAFQTITEEIYINAPVGAPAFDIRVGENPLTTAIDRSRIIISQSGSLSNQTNVFIQPPATLPLAGQIYVEVEDGDVYVEGRVAATNQTWLMQSDEMVADVTSNVGDYPNFSPYAFTTKSHLTGVDTGIIEADTLAITLANDTMVLPAFPAGVPIPNTAYIPSRAFASLDISTDVTRLRVQAADREGDQLEVPFPYELAVREEDDLIVDAVAASSRPISITTFNDGDLTTLGHLSSYGDVTLNSGNDFTLLAPLTTVFGQLEINAPLLDIRAAVRVLDTIQDERDVDIRLTASNGPILLQDAVQAINRVILTQSGTAAANSGVSGEGRVFADVLEVNADADVSIRTKSPRVSVRSPGAVTIEELDYGNMEIRDAVSVTLTAGGFDQVVTDRNLGGTTDQAFLSPALYADVFDTAELTVSAPNGSVDVLVSTTSPLAIGSTRVGQPGEIQMSAAGSVVIRTTLGTILVNDAPSATGNATPVIVATTGSLAGVFVPGSDNVIPDRINSVQLARINQKITVLDGYDATALRVGDQILVKNGVDDANIGNIANGIYTVARVSYPVGDTSQLTVDLVRTRSADTTAELAQKTYVRVLGGDTLAGTVWTADGTTRNNGVPEYTGWVGASNLRFANVFDNEVGVTPVVVNPITPVSGFLPVRMRTTEPLLNGNLRATYNSAGGVGTIRGAGPLFRIPDFNGVTPRIGDLVLVADGAGDGSGALSEFSNGVYEVTSLGDGSTQQWELTRYQGVDDNGDGILDRFYTGRVSVNEGSLATAFTGDMYEVGLQSLGYVPIRYQQVTQYDPSMGPFDPILHYRVDIGTGRPASPVLFNVSTEGGTNSAPGGFGRMLQLIQANSAANSRSGDLQEQILTFSPSVQEIALVQELPDIYRELTIQAGSGVFIDGTSIELSSAGLVSRSGSVLTRIGPQYPSEYMVSRRLYRPGFQSVGSQVNGLEILPTAGGTIVSGLGFGGFNNGSAIVVAAPNVLIDNVNVGLDANGGVVANRTGVEFIGNTEHSTLKASTIRSADVGVKINTGSQYVHVVGNTIGTLGAGNGVGVELVSTQAAPNFIGASGLSAVGVISASGLIQAVTPGVDATLEISQTALNSTIRPGMYFLEASSGVARKINSINYRQAGAGGVEKFWVLNIDNPAASPLQVGVLLGGQIGHLVESSTNGVVSNAGQVTAGDTEIVLPGTMSVGDVYLGMQVSSLQGGIGSGNSVTAIRTVGAQTVLELLNPIGESSVSLLLVGEANANDIAYNADGVVIDSISSRLVNSVVRNSVYVGIDVQRTDLAGRHVLGDALGDYASEDKLGRPITVSATSAENLVVYGNGLVGLQLSQEAFAALGALTGAGSNPPTAADYGVIDNYLGNHLVVRGNLFGLTGVGDVVGNGPSGTENIDVKLASGDAHFADLARIDYLLFDDPAVRDALDPLDPEDDLFEARFRPAVDTALDSQFNLQGLGASGSTQDLDPGEVVGDRRPIVR